MLLSGDSANVIARGSCIADLDKLWSYLTDDQKVRLDPLLTEKKGMVATLSASASLTDGPELVVEEILSEVSGLLSREGSSISSWIEP